MLDDFIHEHHVLDKILRRWWKAVCPDGRDKRKMDPILLLDTGNTREMPKDDPCQVCRENGKYHSDSEYRQEPVIHEIERGKRSARSD